MWSSSVQTGTELSIAGVTAKNLAKEFGTPAFIVDEVDFYERATAWNKALKESFGTNAGTVYYAAKAFICTEVARWINDVGIGIDVCTGGELAVALAGGIDPAKIELHGNNKSMAEIEKAVISGVGTIVIDSLYEVERVAAAATKANKVQKVLLRLTPGIEAHTHESIATAHEDVKFGFSIASGAAWDAIAAVRGHSSLELRGFHAHIGSQIFGYESFELSAQRLIGLLARYRDEFKSELPELDLGGGYGIAYLPDDVAVVPADAMKALSVAVTTNCQTHGLKIPTISIEPGRAIVGPTMLTLYEVGTVKDVTLESGLHRRYISVDGGMSDNIRPSLYDAEYTTVLANRTSTAKNVSSRLVGKHCETGDIVIREIDLPDDIVPGDLLAVPATGAYGRSMASNYNHVPRPPVISVKDGKARVIVRRETEDDLRMLDI
ncbi:MAG: diaminopimelate decarboxylase [Actinobacteria bacterium BACL15 MAG-120619-bin91]|jgi:diaminopimelate decarboxylase|uniref:Diaminopimelate decarboxylase n=2 Tax=ac1 cluster TaxID=1655545 RepID=A0A0R2PNQ8_9ACTN|nr:MAG: diaminopimelate decarboxylase [Actinobacteria bacterium BACL15 MAG-120619-bin91]KRO38434.1 MAG: diaminopimelate decarboxylase [Actinobacteria bacterium BACL15 MAG-120823-bin78]MDP5051502.1 diaminopimelate decarboxylase [Candidatus Planktophila sp.]